MDEHRLIHTKPKYEESVLSKQQKDFLSLHQQDSYQEYLVNNNLSEEEFLQIKLKELKKYVR
jgi:cell division protein FtsI/penicillin-binding protein 2